jgi:hypothetical protein
MGFKTKIQLISRKSGYNQWFVNFPSACAQMMGFKKRETAEWEIDRKGNLLLKRKAFGEKKKN